MSNRLKILAVLLKNGAQTYDELEMATQIERSPLRIAVNDAKKAGHISMGRDDVTHQPAYKITADGTKWLKSNAAKKAHEQTQPAVVENTGSRESVSPVGQSRPPAEVAAADRDAGASHDAPAGSNELKFALGMIRKALCIDHDDSIGIVPTIEALIESNNEWRQSADALDIDKTNALQALYAATEEKDRLNAELKLLQTTQQNDYEDMRMFQAKFIATDLKLRQLQAQIENRSPPVDLTEVAIGYLVRIPKRKPRLCMKPERAAEAAQAATKAAGRADVLALVHLGTYRRKKAVTVEYTPTHQDSRHD